MIDIAGREYARLSQLKVGDRVVVDAGFTCMRSGSIKLVFSDPRKRLFISCDDVKHLLKGQLGDDGDSLVGIYKVEDLI